MKILALNPGSASTKVALFDDEFLLWSVTQPYDAGAAAAHASMEEQEAFRYAGVSRVLKEKHVFLSDVDAFVGCGGLLRPLEGGTYRVTEVMLEELRACKWGVHASNLGALLAARFALGAGGKPAYIVDPVVVDEMPEVAHLSGLPELPRRSVFHALNQKAVARRAAAFRGKRADECNFIVVHMGGGVSVGAHWRGSVIEVNNAFEGEGPMSLDRVGSLTAVALADLCFSGVYTHKEVRTMLAGRGGFLAHLGTHDFIEVEQRVRGKDPHAKLVFKAFVYQVAKAVGSAAAALRGEVDSILLTGGMAHSTLLCDRIRDRVAWIAPVEVFPGEDEMRALAEGVLSVTLHGEPLREY